MKPKVLIAAPTSSIKNYCFMEWLLNVRNFTYPDADLFLVDNSHGEEYYNFLIAGGIECMHVEPGNRKTQEFITESQELIRARFLAGNYDYLFSLESDVFPMVPDIIERLMVEDVPVITAPYFIGAGIESELLISYYVKSFVQKNAVFGIVLPRHYGFFLMDGTVKQVSASGIGCTLIKREVMEEIPFRYEEGSVAHSDSYFYTDLWKNGIPAYIHTGLLTRHYNTGWATVINTWR